MMRIGLAWPFGRSSLRWIASQKWRMNRPPGVRTRSTSRYSERSGSTVGSAACTASHIASSVPAPTPASSGPRHAIASHSLVTTTLAYARADACT